MEQPDFRNQPLDAMVAVGAVGARSCRVWVRTGRPGPYRLDFWPERSRDEPRSVTFRVAEGNASDDTHCVELGAGEGPPLAPRTRYEFRVAHEPAGEPVGAGRFETFPARPDDTPDRFSIAVLSCNQPFGDDGAINRDSLGMLRAARRVLDEHDCKLVLTVGDQMYADCPRPLSLFDEAYFRRFAPPGRVRLTDCSPDEVRRLYHRRYRHFFAPPEWQALHADFPCYPIFDDHEIVDNWGSLPEHRNPEWQSVWRGARAAYCDYQASRVLTEPEARDHFGYPIEYGDVALYVVDLRSHRTGNGGRLLAEAQLAELEAFLASHTDAQALFVVLSVPAVHLPRWASRLASRVLHSVEDFSDRWSAPGHLADRNRLLELLHAHQSANPDQPVVLLSGDIHIGCVHRIAWDDGVSPLYQMVSSPISHGRGRLESLAGKLSIQANRRITIGRGTLRAAVRRLPPVARSMHNPYAGLNVGVVEFGRRGGAGAMEFLLYGQKDGEPVRVFRSRPIPTRNPRRALADEAMQRGT